MSQGKSDVWEARPTGECTYSGGTTPPDGGTPKGIPTLKEAQADEAAKTSSTLFQQIKASIRTLDTASVEAVQPGRAANPINVKRVERIVSSTDWQTLFAIRDASYTYTRFLQAIAKFPAVCDDYSDGRNADAICRKGLATMFAHFAQETGAHDPGSPFRNGVKACTSCAKLVAAMMIRAVVTTLNVTRVHGKVKLGLAVKTRMAHGRNTMDAAPNNSRTTTTTVPSLMPCLALYVPYSISPNWYLTPG